METAAPVAAVATTSQELPSLPEARRVAVVIPGTTAELPPLAFFGCTQLVSVEIQSGVTVVGQKAFDGCTGLVRVTLPDGLTRIDPGAFKGCTHLAEINMPPSVNKIEHRAFEGCASLARFVIPEAVDWIMWSVFDGCAALTSIEIPKAVTKIGPAAFAGCKSLTSVAIPEGVTYVDSHAFSECEHLIVATLPRRDTHFVNANHKSQVFVGCRRLQYVIAPAMLDNPANHFDGTPVLSLGGLVDDTPTTRLRASALRFWSRATHHLCSEARRQWVVLLMLVAGRLSTEGRHVPPEVWVNILGAIPRDQLGPKG
eukprot:m.136322 g.136322  ORF g.136322 m.136322 type:complete len:313 (+) comp13936_c0_seq2:2498-3436(+)